MFEIEFHPGTENITRANFINAFYYINEKSFEMIADMVIHFDKKGSVRSMLNQYREKKIKMKTFKNKLKMYENNDLYIELWEVKKIRETLQSIEPEIMSIKTDLVGFILETMESKKLLKKQISLIMLKNIPLATEGSKTEEDYSEEESSDDETDDDF